MAGLGIRELGRRGAVVGIASLLVVGGTSTGASAQSYKKPAGGQLSSGGGGGGSQLPGAFAAGQGTFQIEKPGRDVLRHVGIIVDYPSDPGDGRQTGVAEAGWIGIRPHRGIHAAKPSGMTGGMGEGQEIVFRSRRVAIEGREAFAAGARVLGIGSLGQLGADGLGPAGVGSTSSQGDVSGVTASPTAGQPQMLAGLLDGKVQGGVGAFEGQVTMASGQAEAQALDRTFRRLHAAQPSGFAGAQSELGDTLLRSGVKPTLPTDPPTSGQGGTIAVLRPSTTAGWTQDGSVALDLIVQAPAGAQFVLFEADTGTILFRGRVHRPTQRPIDPPTQVEVKLPNAAKDLNLTALGLLAWID